MRHTDLGYAAPATDRGEHGSLLPLARSCFQPSLRRHRRGGHVQGSTGMVRNGGAPVREQKALVIWREVTPDEHGGAVIISFFVANLDASRAIAAPRIPLFRADDTV